MKRNILTLLLSLTIAIVALSFTYPQDKAVAKKAVPAEYKSKVNPYKGDESLKMLGLKNFNRHCVSCHGKKGIGDGIMAKNLSAPPGDLSSSHMDQYTDGELYYLSFIGINERPDFMKLIPDEEEKWAIINYVRTLKAE